MYWTHLRHRLSIVPELGILLEKSRDMKDAVHLFRRPQVAFDQYVTFFPKWECGMEIRYTDEAVCTGLLVRFDRPA